MGQTKYINRATRQENIEDVYGEKPLRFLYGDSLSSRLLGTPLSHLFSKSPLVSKIYGWLQKLKWSKRKIAPFIKRFKIDSSEFLEAEDGFQSFNDFFIRRLKKEARPIAAGTDVAIIPADGRYRFLPHIASASGFIVKGQKFCLTELLGNAELAEQYAHGSMVMARLCPVDYHRFHFPCDGTPGTSKPIAGHLYSVNPIALKKNIHIYTSNKRIMTEIKTSAFGKILYLEVGATNVGTIHQTYTPDHPCHKGDEKGYFSFGGSALLLLFPPQSIKFSQDLLELSKNGLEILCLMGQPMGAPPI